MSNKKNSKTKPKKSRKSTLKPARKSRTKTRKPKYLSLKLQLSSSSSTSSNHQPKTLQQRKPSKTLNMQQQKQQKLINLFPLRPENLVEQEHKDHQDHDQDQDHVAFLLQTTTDNTSTSLHDILDSNTATTTTSEEEEGSPSLSYFRGHENDHHENHQGLLRTAMKSCKERNESEERWVSYWEVVEKKELEEVSSDNSRVNCCYAVADALEKMVMKQIDHHDHEEDDKKLGLVGLKLDYQEILNAWSDKGPLYINGGVRDGESPQTVPDLLDASSNGIMDGWGSIWKVPEWGNKEGIKKEKEEWKMGQREASVLRYKEKRQNRLFSKRIRYQVRKLNAEKRPRLKGRFVKRNGEE